MSRNDHDAPAAGTQGAVSAAYILQHTSVVLQRCTSAGSGSWLVQLMSLVLIAMDSSQSLFALLCLHQEEATLYTSLCLPQLHACQFLCALPSHAAATGGVAKQERLVCGEFGAAQIEHV